MSVSPPRTKSNTKNILYSLTGTGVALVLLFLLFTRLNVTLETVWNLLVAVPLWGLVAVIILTVLTFGLSAYQWQMILAVSKQAAPDDDSPSDFLTLFFYTTLGGVLGLIVPIQISTPLVRSMMLRVRDKTSLVRGGATSVIEQSVALLIPVLFCLPGILALQGKINVQVWIVLMLLLLALGWVLMVWLMPLVVKRFVAWFKRSQSDFTRWKILAHLALRLEALVDTPLLSPKVLQALYSMALVRYVVLMLRIIMMMYMLQLDVPPIYAVYIVPTAQIIQLVNLTPANLGLREWTWVGMLVLAGVDASVAANYALAQRGLVIFATVSTGLLISLAFLLVQRFNPPKSLPAEGTL